MITYDRIANKVKNNLQLTKRNDVSLVSLHGFVGDAVMELRADSEITFEVSVELTNGVKYFDVDGMYDKIIHAEFPWKTEPLWCEWDRLIEHQNETSQPSSVCWWSNDRVIITEADNYSEKLRIGFSSASAITTGEEVKLHCTISQYEEVGAGKPIPLPQSIELVLQHKATANAAAVHAKDEFQAWEARYERALRKWKIDHAITQHKTPMRTYVRRF